MVEDCTLKLYTDYEYQGDVSTYNESGSVWSNTEDNDYSARLEHKTNQQPAYARTDTCNNTSYIVLEHPYSVDNGGTGYLIGRRDKVDGLWDDHKHQDGQRYWKRGGRAAEVIRINVPPEDIDNTILRYNLDIHGRRFDGNDDPLLYITRDSASSGTDGANSPEQLLANKDDKGQPCPGGEAYWLNATDGLQNSTSASIRKAQVACIYKNKEGLKTLHNSLSGSSDIRKSMYMDLVNKYCNSATRLNDVISSDTSNNKCKNVVNAIEQAKEYCKSGDNIATDNTFCTKEELGTDNYNQIAKEYCEANPDKDFCGCYNVLNNKCLTEETKDLPGCKVTYPTRESINKMPTEYSSNFDGTDKCWGNVCAAGTGKYVPEGTIDALCSKTVAVCIADLDVGSLKESGVNIEQNCGSNNQTNQTMDGSTEGTPAPMRDNIPLETTTATTSTPSPSSEDGDEEEKAFYEKPEVQIGTVASSLISIISCFMLIILAM